MNAQGKMRRNAVLCAIAATAIATISFSAWAETEVRVIATGEPYGNAMKKAAEIYKERTGVSVIVDQYPYSEAYNKEVLLGSSNSNEYDIMVLDCIWLPLFVKNNWVQPFDPLEANAKQKIDWNGFVPGIVDAYDRYNGKLYAAPIDFFIEVMAYRADLFEAAGLSEAPKTWDEFRTYAEKLNQPDKGIYGVVTMPGEQDAGYSEWTVRLASLSMPANANQFVWDKDFKSALKHEDNGKKALDLWLDIKPYVAPGANEMGYAESTNAFMQGNGAMFINWYMTFSDVENPETSKVVGKVKYALPPRNTLEGDRHDYLGGFQIAIAANAPNPGAAYDFISFLTTDEGQAIMLENGAPGAYRSFVYDDPKWLARYPFLAPVKEAQVMIPLTSDFAEYVEMQRVIYDELFAAWAGNKSSDEAMAKADEGLDGLLKQLGYQK
jgi:ABC-type glycerol-3-phosphate transport system substrate-binding protein